METKERSRTRIGFSRMEKKYEWKDHVIFMGILLATAVWVNRNIEIKGPVSYTHLTLPKTSRV